MGTLIIALAAFIGVTALVGGVALLLRGGPEEAVEARLEMLTSQQRSGRSGAQPTASLLTYPLDDQKGLLEAIISHWNLRTFLEQADAPLTASRFLAVMLGLGSLGVIACVLSGLPLLAAPLAAAVLAALPWLWLIVRRRRRLATFGRQLPEALELLSRALRAGHSLAAGCSLVADEMADPIAKEFSRCYEEQNLGIPLDEALEDMTRRVPNLDLRFFATAVILQRQTGGDLAEILDKIGNLVRQRFQIWGQIQALTGEGRLSGIVLLALPPVLFVAMYRLNPEYCLVLFNDPMGQQMLAGAVVLQVVGALVIRHIINIKV